MSIGKEYLRVVRERFAIMKGQGERTFAQLNEEDFYWTMNNASNSIAILIQHVSGNMISRWTDFMTTDGEKPDRNRDEEFESKRMSKEQLMDCWERGWRIFLDTLDNLSESDLEKTIYIRGEAHSVIDAIERQMAHYAAHIGQIMFIGKQIKGEQWENLSIPKGGSDAYLAQKLKGQ
ncbi:DUF1572 domain-containing protein [Sporosarcina sp. ACRSL]|uniref:DUF1572 family protein n=1 Tax=Sporosarcina sp. ACRSL TaxID=2918215 RepID=UPI001EF5839D|nr:DUF1572 family protein [Sporosarcina sp. ACRSL]MCG7345955.1 DUF1572 domain-containing protein [Sporosarcina sp. ACRSL]